MARSARRSPARSAAARATRTLSSRCDGPRTTSRPRWRPDMSTTEETAATTPEERPIGFGRLRRKEDPRFIRGLGKYVDDIKLPGMLHGAVLRSPLAHARIKSIDTSAAMQHPKVHAVITGADPEGRRGDPRGGRGGPEAGLDADDVLRHAGRAGHRQGALPGPGGRVRRGRR